MKVGDLEHFKNMSFLAHSARGALRIVIHTCNSIASLLEYNGNGESAENNDSKLQNHYGVLEI